MLAVRQVGVNCLSVAPRIVMDRSSSGVKHRSATLGGTVGVLIIKPRNLSLNRAVSRLNPQAVTTAMSRIKRCQNEGDAVAIQEGLHLHGNVDDDRMADRLKCSGSNLGGKAKIIQTIGKAAKQSSASYLIPQFDGALFTNQVPRRLRRSVERYSIVKTA